MASEAKQRSLPRRLIEGCRSFRARIVLRVLLIGATLWLLFHTTAGGWGYPAVTAAAGLLLLYQVYGLVRFVDRTNRDLARFLAAVRYADFSQTFVTGGSGSSFDELRTAFNEVLDAFRLARAEKEEQARYLQTVVQHIGVGLVVFDGGGRVSLINNAAKRLLGVPRLGGIADLDRVSPGLAASLKNLGPRGRDLVRFGETQLALHASVFRSGDREHTLVALQDIGPDLDEKETEAWQNLIRVLTHEIMNSITPIASLAATADGMLKEGGLDGETAGDIRTAVGTIQRRSEGLLQFVETYRGLTRVPAPLVRDRTGCRPFRPCRAAAGAAVRRLGFRAAHPGRSPRPRAHGGSRSGRAGPHQPAEQRPRSCRGRRRGARRPERSPGAREGRRRGRRQRAGDRRRGARQAVHPLLHDQAERLRHRPEPVPPDHEAPPRLHLGALATGGADGVLAALLKRPGAGL